VSSEPNLNVPYHDFYQTSSQMFSFPL
jgi:hypothetical protein